MVACCTPACCQRECRNAVVHERDFAALLACVRMAGRGRWKSTRSYTGLALQRVLRSLLCGPVVEREARHHLCQDPLKTLQDLSSRTLFAHLSCLVGSWQHRCAGMLPCCSLLWGVHVRSSAASCM